MPIVKNRQDRLRVINQRLNRWGGHPAPTAELARLCAVSLSTIKQDIDYLKDVHDAPIQYARNPKGYYYTRPFDLAASITLTEDDLARLETAVATLNQFSGLAIFRDLRGTVDKLEKAVRFRFRHSTEEPQRLHFERVPYFRGSEHIADFLSAIPEGRIVMFTHQRFDTDAKKTHRVVPHLIKEHRNRWYVVAYQLDYGQLRVFGLDRIVPGSLMVTADIGSSPDFDADTYFRHSLGVAVYEDQWPEAVVLSFTPQQGRYFRAQPFFPYAEPDVLRDDEAEFRVRLHVIVNKELVYELARLGDQVRVLAPGTLIEQIRAFLTAALNRYS